MKRLKEIMKTNPSALSSINPHAKEFGAMIKVGIFGLGTVGRAVAEVLQKNAELIQTKTGLQISVKAACDLRKIKAEYFDVTKDPDDILKDDSISVVIETMGGLEPAKAYVLAALRSGKHVVTSNKELIANYLDELLKVAKANGVSILYEGAVGGGIPILNTIRDNLSANSIDEIYGIVNGTTNYILYKMASQGMEFAQALKLAQQHGYAEANPKNDLAGYDAAFKAVILAATAFRAKVAVDDIYRQGIEDITAEDIQYAKEMGYVIKLLAVARREGGRLDIRVHPALVPQGHPLANVNDNFNAIYVKGFPVGELMFYGPGAGGNPTASAVVNDIIKVSKTKGAELRSSHFELRTVPLKPISEIEGRYYLRLEVPDRHGVLAGISKTFADEKVSIAAVVQKETKGNVATIVIMLDTAKEANVQLALAKLEKLPVVKRIANLIRII